MHQTCLLQKRIFDVISQQVGKAKLAATLANHLHLTKSAIYKRIRLEKILTFDELIILAKIYKLSLDQLLLEV